MFTFAYEDRQALINYLCFIHGIIRASEALLEHAISKLEDGPVRRYYVAHLREERGHAAWLADDLASVGVQPGLNWKAARLAGSQVYLIEYVSPVALLGYMAALEGQSTSLATIEALEIVHGKTLLRTARYHAEHDPAHWEDLAVVIFSLPEHQQQLIWENAKQTLEQLT